MASTMASAKSCPCAMSAKGLRLATGALPFMPIVVMDLSNLRAIKLIIPQTPPGKGQIRREFIALPRQLLAVDPPD